MEREVQRGGVGEREIVGQREHRHRRTDRVLGVPAVAPASASPRPRAPMPLLGARAARVDHAHDLHPRAVRELGPHHHVAAVDPLEVVEVERDRLRRAPGRHRRRAPARRRVSSRNTSRGSPYSWTRHARIARHGGAAYVSRRERRCGGFRVALVSANADHAPSTACGRLAPCARTPSRGRPSRHREPGDDGVRLRLHRRPRAAAPPVRQGHASSVDRQRPPRLVTRGRPREPGRLARRDHPDLRHRVVGQDDRGRARQPPSARRGVAVQPVHARRAGRADVRGEDRADRARHRLEVLRGHPGDRRSPPRRGVQPLPPREAPARLPAEPAPRSAARRRDRRPALGHDLPRDAGDHRGARARGVRRDPQPGHRSVGARAQRVRDAGRGAARDVRTARACATSTRSSPTPSATSARSSASTRAT